MLRWIRSAVLACAAATLLGMEPHTPVFVDPSTPISVKAGEDFFVALTSNPTTGYSWTQRLDDASMISYEGNVYEPLSQFNDATGSMGAAGQQIFIFHANRTGETSVTFSYARPFEKDVPPVKTVTANIFVQ